MTPSVQPRTLPRVSAVIPVSPATPSVPSIPLPTPERGAGFTPPQKNPFPCPPRSCQPFPCPPGGDPGRCPPCPEPAETETRGAGTEEFFHGSAAQRIGGEAEHSGGRGDPREAERTPPHPPTLPSRSPGAAPLYLPAGVSAALSRGRDAAAKAAALSACQMSPKATPGCGGVTGGGGSSLPALQGPQRQLDGFVRDQDEVELGADLHGSHGFDLEVLQDLGWGRRTQRGG